MQWSLPSIKINARSTHLKGNLTNVKHDQWWAIKRESDQWKHDQQWAIKKEPDHPQALTWQGQVKWKHDMICFHLQQCELEPTIFFHYHYKSSLQTLRQRNWESKAYPAAHTLSKTTKTLHSRKNHTTEEEHQVSWHTRVPQTASLTVTLHTHNSKTGKQTLKSRSISLLQSSSFPNN